MVVPFKIVIFPQVYSERCPSTDQPISSARRHTAESCEVYVLE